MGERGLDGWTIELGLRNALEEFLCIDRDETPPRLDLQLFDKAHAERKLAEIVKGRLAIIRAMAGSTGPADARKRIEKLGPHFERLRIWEVEGGNARRGRR